MRKWDTKAIALAKGVLSNHSKLEEAVTEISSKLDFDFTEEALERAFRRYKLGALSNFLNKSNTLQQAKNKYLEKEEKKVQRKEEQEQVKKLLLYEGIEQFAERVFSGRVASRSYKSTAPTKRIQNLVLSDLHFGSDLKAEETGALDYGVIEESRRFAKVIAETCDYKIEYRDQTELRVNLLGDFFENSLHDPRTGAPVAEQVCRVLHLILQGLTTLSGSFKTIKVYCVSSNHGRRPDRHKDRATFQKWDSYDTIVYFALRQACANLKNIEFFIPKTPFVKYKVFDDYILSSHGDNFFSTGSVGKSLNTSKIESNSNRINAAYKDQDEIKVIVSGHTHTPSIVWLANGTVAVTNGALSPVSDFCTSLGMLESRCGQYIFESSHGYPLGDSRLIIVDENTDKDRSLDKIVKPWNPGKGLNQ